MGNDGNCQVYGKEHSEKDRVYGESGEKKLFSP
jgi:hypothetical protein